MNSLVAPSVISMVSKQQAFVPRSPRKFNKVQDSFDIDESQPTVQTPLKQSSSSSALKLFNPPSIDALSSAAKPAASTGTYPVLHESMPPPVTKPALVVTASEDTNAPPGSKQHFSFL